MSDDNKPTVIHTEPKPRGIEDLLHEAYLKYSLSVNVGRAIPDVRDGLKPGMRRVLFSMRQNGQTKASSYTKCARVVGDVIGKYHPHGDSSVYDTMVRMAQPFSMRYTLIDGQGNFGSIDGDPPAAYRYTECRMEKLAEELLTDLDKDTVDMRPNFDEKEMEPTVLPARYPNLLVNGTTGIGVGMATSIPPHNLREVINATVALLDKPTITVTELMEHLPGPDFPTGGTIVGVAGIRKLYETGHGSVYCRGKAEIKGDENSEQIIITEIPYAVNKENMVKKIAELVNNKVITGINSLNDESSDRIGIRVVIGIKRGAMAMVVLNQLYKHTQLATSYGCQFLVVYNNQPRTLTLKQLLQAYLDHRLEVITRRIVFDLDKAEKRAHIVEGLLKAVDNIDEVIKIIRNSHNKDDAHTALSERFDLSRRQTTAILEMRLSQLTGLAIEDLENEFKELMDKIAYYKELLGSREKRLSIVREELIEVRDKYGDDRISELRLGSRDINMEDLIPRESIAITISNDGYIKRVPTSTYRTQNRGGKGVVGMTTKDEDHVEHLMTACSHDYILFFTNKGLMHWIKGYDIPEGARTGKGKNIVNLLEFEPDEAVRAMITVDELDVDNRYILMATRNGVVKKTELKAFRHLRKKPIKAIVLDEGDDLIEAKLTEGNNEILLSTEQGIACRFLETAARPLGRVSRGVRGIRLNEGDKVVSMIVVTPEMDILVVTSLGMGKRSAVADYRLTNRGAKGVKSIKLKEGDKVVEALRIIEGDEIIMTTMLGQMVRIAADPIRTIGRTSQGVKILTLKKEGDFIISVSRVMTVENEEQLQAIDETLLANKPTAPANTEAVNDDADEELNEEIDDEDLTDDEEIDDEKE